MSYSLHLKHEVFQVLQVGRSPKWIEQIIPGKGSFCLTVQFEYCFSRKGTYFKVQVHI